MAKCVDIFKHLQTIFFSSSKFLAVQTNNHDSLGFSGLMVGTGFQHQLYADMQAFIPFLLTHSCCGESVESRIKRFSCSLCCRNEQRNVAMGGLLMDPGGSLRPTFWYSVWNYRRRSQQLQQRERWPWDVSCFVEASQSHSWPWAICHTFLWRRKLEAASGSQKSGENRWEHPIFMSLLAVFGDENSHFWNSDLLAQVVKSWMINSDAWMSVCLSNLGA